MNGSASTNDDMISVGPPVPKIVEVEPLDARKVRITWKSGESKIVDLAPALESRRIYIPLRGDAA